MPEVRGWESPTDFQPSARCPQPLLPNAPATHARDAERPEQEEMSDEERRIASLTTRVRVLENENSEIWAENQRLREELAQLQNVASHCSV
jgi:predicted RNase H-like nuclease (RuvC/YqgF family)